MLDPDGDFSCFLKISFDRENASLFSVPMLVSSVSKSINSCFFRFSQRFFSYSSFSPFWWFAFSYSLYNIPFCSFPFLLPLSLVHHLAALPVVNMLNQSQHSRFQSPPQDSPPSSILSCLSFPRFFSLYLRALLAQTARCFFFFASSSPPPSRMTSLASTFKVDFCFRFPTPSHTFSASFPVSSARCFSLLPSVVPTS